MDATPQMHTRKDAETQYQKLVEANPDNKYLVEHRNAIIDTLANFGNAADATRTTIPLTEEERGILKSDLHEVRLFMAQLYDASVAVSHKQTPIDEDLFNYPGIENVYGFLNYDWVEQFYLSLYDMKHKTCDEGTKKLILEIAADLKASEGRQMKDFYLLTMRDVMLFNRYQQLIRFDTKARAVNIEAAAIYHLLSIREVLPLLFSLLNIQTVYATINDQWADVTGQPISHPEDYLVLQEKRRQIPKLPDILRMVGE